MPVFTGNNIQTMIGSSLDAITGSNLTTNTLLDGITKVTIEYGTGMAPVGQVGQRQAFAIIGGKISIGGTINRFYTGSGILDFIMGTNETGSITATPNLGIYPNGAVSGQPFIAIQNVYFSNYRNAYSPGSTLMNEVEDFVGIRYWTGSLP